MKRPWPNADNGGSLADAAAPLKKRQRPDADAVHATDPFFERLPDELILHVLALVDNVGTVGTWSLTSRRHHALAADDSLWRHLCLAHFGPPLHERPWPAWVDWRWIYRAQSHPANPKGADVGAVQIKGGRHIYWGDTVDGKPHGFGIAVNPHDNCHLDTVRERSRSQDTLVPFIRRQGHWTEGEMHGDCVKAYPNGTRFEGRWHYGKRPSVGTLYYASGGRYVGECKSYVAHGHGTRVHTSGNQHTGQWECGRPCGEGTDAYANGDVFIGDWTDNEPYRGTYVWADGSRYDGEFNPCGQSHGRGSMVDANGDRYDGQWHNDFRHGRGIALYANGDRYEGEWYEDEWHGTGVFIDADGDRCEGQWHRDHMHGGGTATYADGGRYKGRWQDGQRHGHGVMIYANGDRYEGGWDSGRRHGRGVYTRASGEQYSGVYDKGRRRGRGAQTFADGSRLSGVWEGAVVSAHGRVEIHRPKRPCLADDMCEACVVLANG